jgi:lantibiotic modifying enzyme
LSEKGPLQQFKGRRIRHVFRPTSRYVQLLQQSWHPTFARDAIKLESHLKRSLSALDDAEFPGRIVAREMRDLFAGDVPYFSAPLATKKKARPNLLGATLTAGWQSSRERIADLSALDRQRQVWLTEMSFVNFARTLPRTRPPRVRGSVKDLVHAATTIGDELCALAILRKGRASWLLPTLVEYPPPQKITKIVPAVAGFDLYDGLAGIGLFLARLYDQTGNPRYREIAEAAFREAISLYRDVPQNFAPIGAYDGVPGLAFALSLASRWLERSAWRRLAADTIRQLARHAGKAVATDVITGRAGLLLAGTAVAKECEDSSLLRALRPVVQNLRALRTRALPTRRDFGVAHGRAGIGFALARFALDTGNTRLLARGTSLIRSDADRGKVSHSDETRVVERMSLAWCRGAAGRELALLRLDQANASATSRLVEVCLQDLKWRKSDPPLCLCHGLAGCLDFAEAARRAGIGRAGLLTSQIENEILARVRGGEFSSDHAHRLYAPGLMTGMAGTGYSLLRMMDPESTPSVLTFG